MRISDWSSDVCSSDLRARASVLATGNLNLNVQQYASNNRALDEARFNASPNGSSLADSGAVVSAQITRNQANTGNKSRAELKRWFSDTAARAADVAEIGGASCRERVCQYG